METQENNLEYYEEERLTFIPLPDSNQYNNRNIWEMRDLVVIQYVDSGITIREMFKHLSGVPFLLQDGDDVESNFLFMD